MAAIIGRKAEMDALTKYNNSDKSEFIAIYGRRRVGKTKHGAQIDLVIDRADGITDICEAKYSMHEFVLDKTEYNKVLKRKEAFDTAVEGKSTRLVLFTTKGMKKNAYSDVFQAIVTLNDLYK